MSRKMMTKEVTTTTVKVGKIEMVDGKPQVVELPSEVLMGNVNQEKAQKLLNKKYDEPITIFEVNAETTVYEMEVAEFIKVATVKEPEPEQE